MVVKVHIFWEGQKIFRNLHQLLEWQYIGQVIGKGQIKSKSRLERLRFCQKMIDLFAVKSKKANKTNLSVRFLGESMARQSAFEINWSLEISQNYVAFSEYMNFTIESEEVLYCTNNFKGYFQFVLYLIFFRKIIRFYKVKGPIDCWTIQVAHGLRSLLSPSFSSNFALNSDAEISLRFSCALQKKYFILQ